METKSDIEIPEIGLSFRGVVEIVDGLLHRQARHVGGEITQAGNKTHLEVVVHIQGGSQPLTELMPDEDPDKAIGIASQDALFLIDPLVGAIDALNRRDYSRAINEFLVALKNNSRNADTIRGALAAAYLDRGEQRLDAKDYSLAIDDFSAAIDQDSRLSPAFNDRGAAEQAQKRFAAALADYNQAIALSPSDVSALLNRGFLFLTSGQCDQAVLDLQKVAASKLGEADGYNGWAWILATCPNARFRDGARAISLSEKACSRMPLDASFQDTLAAAYAEAGDFDKAASVEETAISYDNTIAEFRTRLALYQSRKPYREPITVAPLPLPVRVSNSPGRAGWWRRLLGMIWSEFEPALA
ncbi:MAG TPA: tetratricopeptide repeat protein [Candidatus Binataceae bacterium]|nr:tetratricopeptide repeat protein [Candidatus Binataceae bacterium]